MRRVFSLGVSSGVEEGLQSRGSLPHTGGTHRLSVLCKGSGFHYGLTSHFPHTLVSPPRTVSRVECFLIPCGSGVETSRTHPLWGFSPLCCFSDVGSDMSSLKLFGCLHAWVFLLCKFSSSEKGTAFQEGFSHSSHGYRFFLPREVPRFGGEVNFLGRSH